MTTRRKHLFLPVLSGIYIAFLLAVVSLNITNRALFVTLLALAYLSVNIIHDAKHQRLGLTRMLEISVLALLAQYLLLFAI